MDRPEILNLDTIVPKRRVITLTGKVAEPKSRVIRFICRFIPVLRKKPRKYEIDVSMVNVRTALEVERNFARFAQLSLEFAKEPQDDDQEIVEEMYRLILSVCKQSFPEISKEWLMENLTPEQVLAVFEFILEPLRERVEKNARAARSILESAR